MADQKLDGPAKTTDESDASTAAEKSFDNEGGAPPASSSAPPAPASFMDRIEHAAGRIKARLTARSS